MKLALIYTPCDGRPLVVGTVRDQTLVRAAAVAAVRERRQDARRLAEGDSTLGMLATEDTDRLERTLKALLP